MSAIKSVFPSTRRLLCLWHIAKNILTHCKPALVTKEVEKKQQQSSGPNSFQASEESSSKSLSKKEKKKELDNDIDDVWAQFTAHWYEVTSSKTFTDFEVNWKKLCKDYEDYPTVLSYLQKQWLPLKEHFVDAWVSTQLHFNNRATSRAEGLHGGLKRHLLVNTGDLSRIHENAAHLINRQVHELEGAVETAKTKLIWDFRRLFFDEI